MKKKLLTLLTLLIGVCSGAWGAPTVVGYTEAINGTKLDARVLSNGGLENLAISATPSFGSDITNYAGTSKDVYIDNTKYSNTDSWRKKVKSSEKGYGDQYVGYTLNVGSGYKMNISKVNARIAVADDTYTWYVEILNSTGTQVWKSSERTTTKATSGKIDNVDVTDKEDIQGLTGSVTVKLWVKQGGSTKYFSINYLQLSIELVEDSRTNYTITANVADGQESYGSIDKAGDNYVPEGDAISLTATANAGYAFVNWTKDDVVVATTSTISVTDVTANATYIAHFKQLYRASYSLGEYAGTITGKVLCTYNAANSVNEIYADKDDNYTIPAYAHKYLYRDGYTFAGWSYGGNIYNSGDIISGLTSNITITPTWTPTTQSLGNASAETEVTWSLAKADVIFVDWQSTDKYGYYTQTASVNGETIAIPMQITKGKVGNYNRSDVLAQTNPNTTFTIPAVSGMTIAISDAYKELSTTTIAGSTEYTGSGSKSISYTYTGSDETIDIVIGENNQYLKTIEVTYPKTHTFVDVTSAGYRTFASSSALDFTSGVAGLTAYKATVSGDDVTFSEITTAVPAKTGMLLKGDEGRYYIPLASGDPAAIDNAFVGVTASTEVTEPAFILYKDETHPIGFYKTSAASFTMGANTAYLPASVAPARSFIGFEEGETTGISSMNVEHSTLNIEHYYDLQGRRVAQPTKGLYIVNGKKVIVK